MAFQVWRFMLVDSCSSERPEVPFEIWCINPETFLQGMCGNDATLQPGSNGFSQGFKNSLLHPTFSGYQAGIIR